MACFNELRLFIFTNCLTEIREAKPKQQTPKRRRQGQLLSDVGSLKSQLVDSIRQQRSARTTGKKG